MNARRLQVLQIGKFYPPYKGGMGTHLQALCTAIQDDVDLRVVVANVGRETVRERVSGVDVTRLGTLLNIGAAPYTPGLRRLIGECNADIVHLHVPHPTAVLSLLTSGFRGRLLVTYHSDIVRQRILGTMFRPFLDIALRQASAIICTSPNYIDSSPVLAAHRERCRVLPFGVPLERFTEAPHDAVAAIKSRYGTPLILAVGRLVSYKGFEYLVRAMRDIPAKLLLIGNGPLRDSLGAVAADAGAAERVVFLSEVNDVTPFLHAADVFVLPSIARSEAFGLVQLEAMAAGTPVVNTRLASGVPYVSPHDVTGLTVPPRDAGALATAVNALLADPDRCRRYGAAGRARAESHFSVAAMARSTLELYDAAMRIPPRTAVRGELPVHAVAAG